MRRREKPKPALGPGEHPPCGFQWQEDADDGHVFATGCACGLPFAEHPRYVEAMRRAIAEEAGTGLRRTIECALARRIQVNERTWPLKVNPLPSNGKRRIQIDDESIELDE